MVNLYQPVNFGGGMSGGMFGTPGSAGGAQVIPGSGVMEGIVKIAEALQKRGQTAAMQANIQEAIKAGQGWANPDPVMEGDKVIAPAGTRMGGGINAIAEVLAKNPHNASVGLELLAKHAMEQAKPGAGYSLSPGGARYNAQNRLVAERPETPKDQYRQIDRPVGDGKMQRMISHDNGKTWEKFGATFDSRDPFVMTQEIDPKTGEVVRFAYPRQALAGQMAQQGANGRVELSRSAPTTTDTQAVTGLYADRMAASNRVIEGVERQGTDWFARLAERMPGGNYIQSPEYQQYEQARRDFVNSVLRRESGAVISDDEFKNAERQYFPAPGDTKTVIDQKRRNRETALHGMVRAAGKGYKPAEQSPNPQQEPATSSRPAVPEVLKAMPGLQWNPDLRLYRDPATGQTYDEKGAPK